MKRSWDVSSREQPPHYIGHRQRLRERFLSTPDAMPDYEIVELLLCFTVPRKDMKPLAKEVLKGLGSLSEVICGPENRLRGFKGLGESSVTLFRLILEVCRRLLREEMKDRPLLSNLEAVLQYCQVTMGFLEKEQFRVLLLDKKHCLIHDYIQQEGTLDQTPLYPREVLKQVFQYNAAGLILVHNHPSGNPTPSKMDLYATEQLAAGLKVVSVRLIDHLIIGKGNHFSFRQNKLIA